MHLSLFGTRRNMIIAYFHETNANCYPNRMQQFYVKAQCLRKRFQSDTFGFQLNLKSQGRHALKPGFSETSIEKSVSQQPEQNFLNP